MLTKSIIRITASLRYHCHSLNTFNVPLLWLCSEELQLLHIQWHLCFQLVTSRIIYYLANAIYGPASVRHPYSWWYFAEDGKQQKSVQNIHVRCVAVSAAKNQSIYYSSTHIGRCRSQKKYSFSFSLAFLPFSWRNSAHTHSCAQAHK